MVASSCSVSKSSPPRALHLCHVPHAADAFSENIPAVLFAGHDPGRGSGQKIPKSPRVESGRARMCLKSHGSGRVGSGCV